MNKYLVIFTYLSDSFDCPSYISDLLVTEANDKIEAQRLAVEYYPALYGKPFSQDEKYTGIEVVPFEELTHGWVR